MNSTTAAASPPGRPGRHAVAGGRTGRSSTAPPGPSAAARLSAPSAPATPIRPLPDTSTSWSSSRAVSSGFIWVVAAPRCAAARVTAADRTPPQSTRATRSPAPTPAAASVDAQRPHLVAQLAVGAGRAVVDGQRQPVGHGVGRPVDDRGQVLADPRSGSAGSTLTGPASTARPGPRRRRPGRRRRRSTTWWMVPVKRNGEREVADHRQRHRVADGEPVAADRPAGQGEVRDLDRPGVLAVDHAAWPRRHAVRGRRRARSARRACGDPASTGRSATTRDSSIDTKLWA